jgi:hypothetical protein
MTPRVLLNLFPRSGRLFGRIGQAVIQDITVPLGNRNLVWRLREALPDVLNELEALGRGELEDFVSEGALAHARKVLACPRAGKAAMAGMSRHFGARQAVSSERVEGDLIDQSS